MTNIGVTGHRVLFDLARVTRGVNYALMAIVERYEHPFIIYSPLADGADRLVAQHALELIGAKLFVPLPLKQSDYMKDFSQESKTGFIELLGRSEKVIELPACPTRVEAYESVGRFILDHVDVLIALWDGKPSRGRGGTGQIVAEARARNLPLAWVPTNTDQPEWVTLENFP